MITALVTFALVLLVVAGNAWLLLRTAKTPPPPKGVKPIVDDEDQGGW